MRWSFLLGKRKNIELDRSRGRFGSRENSVKGRKIVRMLALISMSFKSFLRKTIRRAGINRWKRFPRKLRVREIRVSHILIGSVANEFKLKYNHNNICVVTVLSETNLDTIWFSNSVIIMLAKTGPREEPMETSSVYSNINCC